MKRLQYTCDLVPILNGLGFNNTTNYSTDVCRTEVFWNGKVCIEIDYYIDSEEVVVSTIVQNNEGSVDEVSIESAADIKILCRMFNYQVD